MSMPWSQATIPEANHEPVFVSREGVNGVALDHVATGRALELAQVGEPSSDLHTLDGLEAVLEDVGLPVEEREAFGAFLHLDLGTLFILGNDEPVNG